MVSEEFKKNMESGNVISVRSALVDYLFVDKSFKQFDEALSEANKKVKIMEPYDGLAMDLEGPWTLDYLNAQKVALMVNFSDERIRHLKKVITSVWGEERQLEKKPQGNAGEKNHSEVQRRAVGRKVISETEIKKQGMPKTHTGQARNAVNARSNTGSAKRTDRNTISKKRTRVESDDDNKINTGLIVGGTAVALGGGIAAASGGGFLAYVALVAGAGTAGAGLYKTFND